MSDAHNVWAGIFASGLPLSTIYVAPYFEEQCEQIEQGSGGRVHARFARIRMEPRSAAQTPAGATLLVKKIADSLAEEERDALSQQDFNDVYDPHTYSFDVYNETYKFRVLTLRLGAMYPIQLKLDKGIQDGLGELLGDYACKSGTVGDIWIDDDRELAGFMEMLATRSGKLRFVLRRLAES